MPANQIPDDLSPQLKSVLSSLREDPMFLELVSKLPRSRLKPWRPREDKIDQEKRFIYESGLVDGEARLVALLLGHDDRTTDRSRTPRASR